jgi:hypothetical protein
VNGEPGLVDEVQIVTADKVDASFASDTAPAAIFPAVTAPVAIFASVIEAFSTTWGTDTSPQDVPLNIHVLLFDSNVSFTAGSDGKFIGIYRPQKYWNY